MDPEPADLAEYGGVNGGTLIDSAVQEYDLRTGRLVYSWVASRHIPVATNRRLRSWI